jgi:phage shock protein PspC (stress-responsive transcriptional regulator)
MGERVGGTLRRGPDRILAGVCSGVAEYLHLDFTLVRIVFVILALVPPGVGIIIYLVLWFLMEPAAPGGAPYTAGQRLRQMGEDLRREFRGGLWRSQSDPGQGIPPTGNGSPAGAPGTPSGSRSGRHGAGNRSSGLWVGIGLILLGVFFLLDNLGYLSGFRWDIFWPVILIAIGLLVLFRRQR